MSWMRVCVERGSRRATRRVAAAGALALVALAGACTAPDATSPAASLGAIKVTVTTSGTDIDVDGYLMSIDGRAGSVRLAPNGELTMAVAPGRHTLVVKDVAPNCAPEVEEFTLSVAADGEAIIDVRVMCLALGRVEVTVVTTGVDLDANGYGVVLEGIDIAGRQVGRIDANGTVTVSRLTAGRHRVMIEGVAANCGGPDLTAREVYIAVGQTAVAAFAVSCAPATWLAYEATEPDGNVEIYAVRSNGAGTTRLTNHPASDEEPAWSPDGTRIAFTSGRDGPRGVYVMNQDGSGVTRLTPVGETTYAPAWSPDGRRIAFVSEDRGNTAIVVMNDDGTNPVRLTTGAVVDTDPAWSPDGTRIAFARESLGSSEIYLMNPDGSGVTRITTSNAWNGHPAWAPDGTRLAFDRQICSSWYWPYNSCYPAVHVITPGLAPVEVDVGDQPAWSADGLRIAATRFDCPFYYWYSDTPCQVAGVGILSVGLGSESGFLRTWDPVLTSGLHRNPAWQ